jgi:hypothetical protein
MHAGDIRRQAALRSVCFANSLCYAAIGGTKGIALVADRPYVNAVRRKDLLKALSPREGTEGEAKQHEHNKLLQKILREF